MAKTRTVNLADLEDETLDGVAETPAPKKAPKKAAKKSAPVKVSGGTSEKMHKVRPSDEPDIQKIELTKDLLKTQGVQRGSYDVGGLAESIKYNGCLRLPLMTTSGKLIDGGRRIRAMMELGFKEAFVRVIDEGTEKGQNIKSLVCNEARENFDDLERAKAYKNLLDAGHVKNQKSIAKLLGLSEARISQILGLLDTDLDAEADEVLRSAKASGATRRAVGKLPKEEQKDAAESVASGKKTVRSGEVSSRPQMIPTSELPDNVRVRVSDRDVLVTISIPENTKTMKSFDLATAISAEIAELDESVNPMIRKVRKEILAHAE